VPRIKLHALAGHVRIGLNFRSSEPTNAAAGKNGCDGAQRKWGKKKQSVRARVCCFIASADLCRTRTFGRNDALRCALARPAACRLHEPTEFAVPRSPAVDGHVRASTLIQESLLPHPPPPLFSFRSPSLRVVRPPTLFSRSQLPLFPLSVSIVFPRASLYLNASRARSLVFDLRSRHPSRNTA